LPRWWRSAAEKRRFSETLAASGWLPCSRGQGRPYGPTIACAQHGIKKNRELLLPDFNGIPALNRALRRRQIPTPITGDERTHLIVRMVWVVETLRRRIQLSSQRSKGRILRGGSGICEFFGRLRFFTQGCAEARCGRRGLVDFSQRHCAKTYLLNEAFSAAATLSDVMARRAHDCSSPVRMDMGLRRAIREEGGLGLLWCRLMHDAPAWPMRNRYRCRICGRIHTFRWDGREVERPVKRWIADTFTRVASRLFILRGH
jgi:hypothetical protein